MIVNELFLNTPTPTLRIIEPAELTKAIGPFWSFKRTWTFTVDGDHYLVFLENDGDIGFAKMMPRTGMAPYRLDLTIQDGRVPFAVLSNVIAAFSSYINSDKPEKLKFFGFEPRQEAFYRRLVPYLLKRIPDYEATTTEENGAFPAHIVLSRRNVNDETLDEDAAKDVNTREQAVKLADIFINYLRENGSTGDVYRPLSSYMRKARIKHDIVYMATAEDMGMPPVRKDLNIGFAWCDNENMEPDNAGYLKRGNRGDMPTYYVLIRVYADPSRAKDMAYTIGSFQKEALVHELTHYFDFKRRDERGKAAIKAPVGDKEHLDQNPQKYYALNHEYQAFFIQGVHAILSQIKSEGKPSHKFRSFDLFTAFYSYNFDANFRQALKQKPTFARKFKQRLYKLYDYLKSREEEQIDPAEAERVALAA